MNGPEPELALVTLNGTSAVGSDPDCKRRESKGLSPNWTEPRSSGGRTADVFAIQGKRPMGSQPDFAWQGAGRLQSPGAPA